VHLAGREKIRDLSRRVIERIAVICMSSPDYRKYLAYLANIYSTDFPVALDITTVTHADSYDWLIEAFLCLSCPKVAKEMENER